MKQKLLYIIMCLICALAWSGEAWGQSSIISVSEDVTMNVSEGDNLTNIRNNNMKCETTISKTNYVSGTKATVTFNMPNAQKSGNNIELDGNSTYTISWAVSANYTMKMTSFGLTGRSAAASPKMKITGGGKTTGDEGVYGVAGQWTPVTLSDISISGTTGSVTLNTNKSSLAIFYIHSFSFNYTLYHNELDLQYLDNAIGAATTAKTGKNSTLQKYLQDAIDTANIYRSEFLFPTYISKRHGTAKVDERTERLKVITAYVNTLNTAQSYSDDNIPHAVWLWLNQYNNYDPNKFSNTIVNNAKADLEAAIAAAKATSSPYLTAKNTTLPAKQVQSDNNNPSGIADSDIEDAYEALELATTTQMITDALALVKNFDSITFNGTTSIAMGGNITNPASAESTRSISYSVPNGTTIMNVSGTTLNAVAPGRVTVTATTGSTGNGYYKCEKTQVYDILPVFYFSVAAQVGTGGGGSVSLEGNQSSVTGAAWNTPSASLDLKFKATPDNGYVFLGWGTTADATTYESSENPYKPELSNSNVGKANEVNKTLYAIFAPQFFFSATFDKNREGGTVTASVANPTITGAPGDESASTTATFTATATEGSYVFKGWKTAANAETYVSQLNPYTTPNNDPDLINNRPGSTSTKTLVAIFAPLYNFSATAEVGSVKGGTVSVSGYSAQVEGAPDATEGTTTATFTATPSTDYKFVGWSESDDGEIVSTDNPYSPTLTNKTPGNTESLTLYAIFKLKHIYLSPTTPNYAPGTYDDVTLSRTLKAGYSTIALPFNTTVGAIVGKNYDSSVDWVAQLSAVTNSVADGYTLYFQKVENGVIEANQPYVLHLGTQVVNPTWTDLENGIGVEEAEATSVQPATGYSGYAGWKMWSNFTPSFPMNGKYGIVNNSQLTGTDKTTYLDGGLMLGSSGSVLNAFTAYIAGPAPSPAGAPRLRVAYVDEDGTTTFIGSLPQDGEQGEPVAVYGPDGQRRNGLQRGVNIVRYADGTTRKVQY